MIPHHSHTHTHTHTHTHAHTHAHAHGFGSPRPWLLIVLLCVLQATQAKQHTIGILLPWSANPLPWGYGGTTIYEGYGDRIHPGITLAFAAIKNDHSLLQEVREMTWVWHDDGCDFEKAIFATEQLIVEYGIEALFGPSCTSVASTVVKAALYYDIPVIGYSIPSFTRSTNTDLPNLIRTIAPYTALPVFIREILKSFGWSHISILYESGDNTGWAAVAEKFNAALSPQFNTSMHYILSAVSAGSSAATQSRVNALAEIKSSGYRIIFIIGSCANNVRLAQELSENSMQNGYAIFSMGSVDGLTCITAADDTDIPSRAFLNNTMFINFETPQGTGEKFSVFKKNASAVFDSFEQYAVPPNGTASRTGVNRGGSNPFDISYQFSSSNLYILDIWGDEWAFLSYLYDGILFYARALNYTLTHGLNTSYQSILSTIPEVSPFEGGWRSVEFNTSDSHGERILEARAYEFIIYNVTVDGVTKLETTATWLPIASYNLSGFSLLVPNDSLIWPGPTHKVPKDYVPTVACTIEDINSYVSDVSASTLTITVNYVFKSEAVCDETDYEFPSDQTLKVNQFPTQSVIGVVIIMCSFLGTTVCLVISVFAVYFRDHVLLQSSKVSLTGAWLALSLVTAAGPLFFLGQPSSALCQARGWILFLPGAMLSVFMVARVRHVGLLMSSPQKNGGGVQGDAIIARFSTLWICPLVLLLIIGSAYEPPSAFSESVQPDHAPLTIIPHFGCEDINESVFIALLIYIAIMVLYGLLISSRVLGGLSLAATLWKSKKRVWEVQYLAYCTYITLAGQVELLVGSLFEHSIGLDRFRVVSSITMSLAASVSLCVIWVPRMAIILNEQINTPDNTDSEPKVSRSSKPMNPKVDVVPADAVEMQDLFDVPARATGGTISFKRSGGISLEKDKLKTKLSGDAGLDDTPQSQPSTPKALL